MLSQEQKAKIIGNNQSNQKDTGSPEVQIALLSERIASLTQHLSTHKRDFTSRVGLLRLVGKRKRLLAYLRREESGRYDALIKKLNLRK